MLKLNDFVPLVLALVLAAPTAAFAQAKPAKAPPTPATAATPPVVPAQSGAQAAKPTDPATEYVLGPEDVVEVEVVGTSDKARGRIYTDGTLQTSLAGRIPAAGRTPKQLGVEIATALKAGGFYSNPVVNVEVVGYASRYVTVLGAVAQPSLVPIDRSYRLSEILARVGGVRGGADYVIVTGADGQQKRYNVDKMASGDPSQDPIINPGEKIFSPDADVFYISGQVKSPGSYPMKSGMTVAQAIAKGGGLTESGSDKKVTVKRGGQKIKLQADQTIEAGDVLSVGERLF